MTGTSENSSSAAPAYVTELRAVIDHCVPQLLAMEDEATARRPAPGKWSPREIVGHLIDSASNNHQRFVRAQFQDSLVFPGYAQDDWVAVQRHQDAPWPELVELWAAFNRHIARVMAGVPEPEKQRPRSDHNLGEIGWQALPAGSPATLDWFMRDYVGHLRHHLRQIPGLDQPPI
ncbi:MAG: DinB family protein [Gemmatimonadetes bacterium]|nr:DinB family protein [Gemmatimonadota bacterium]